MSATESHLVAQSHKGGYLLLEDGSVFRGRSVGAPGAAFAKGRSDSPRSSATP